MANFYNIGGNGVFIQGGDISWVVEYDSTEVLLVRSVFWLSIGGFSSGGAGQVVSLGDMQCIANFYNTWGNGVFIDWGDIPWVVEWDRNNILLVRSVFWLSGSHFIDLWKCTQIE